MPVKASAGRVETHDVDEQNQAELEMLLYRDQLDFMVHLTARYDNWAFSYGDPYNPGDVPPDWE